MVGDGCVSGAPLLLNGSEALRRAESVCHQGQIEWRLPSVKELVSLYSFRTDSEFAGGALIPTNPEFYWSSTPAPIDSSASRGRARLFSLGDGRAITDDKSVLRRVRLVRDL